MNAVVFRQLLSHDAGGTTHAVQTQRQFSAHRSTIVLYFHHSGSGPRLDHEAGAMGETNSTRRQGVIGQDQRVSQHYPRWTGVNGVTERIV